MRRNFWVVLVVGLLWSPAGVRADETYTIKFKTDAKGAQTLQESRETEQSHLKVLDANGKAVEDKEEEKITVLKYRQSVLELPDAKKRPTRLRRQYDKAQLTTDGNAQTLAYEGKTVLIEKKDGKYRFQIEGGDELTGKDAEVLDEEFNKAKDDRSELEQALFLFPKKAVRVNETWKIDPEGLKALSKREGAEMPLDLDKAGGTGRLVRAYRKDGRQFGVLEFRIEMPLKGTIGKEKLEVATGTKMTVQIKLDACIDGQVGDGTADRVAKMDLTGTVKGPDGNDYKVVLNGNSVKKSTQKDLPKE
jgi:hypothetical protein